MSKARDWYCDGVALQHCVRWFTDNMAASDYTLGRCGAERWYSFSPSLFLLFVSLLSSSPPTTIFLLFYFLFFFLHLLFPSSQTDLSFHSSLGFLLFIIYECFFHCTLLPELLFFPTTYFHYFLLLPYLSSPHIIPNFAVTLPSLSAYFLSSFFFLFFLLFYLRSFISLSPIPLKAMNQQTLLFTLDIMMTMM